MSERLLTNVLTRGQFDLPGASIAALIQERFGEDGVTARALTDTIDGEEGFILDVSGTPTNVVYEDFAMQFDDLSVPPSKQREDIIPVVEHRAHANLGVLADYGRREETLEASMAVLQVASFRRTSPGASAFLWVAALTLASAGQLRAVVAASTATPENIPLTIVTRFAGYQDGVEGDDAEARSLTDRPN